MGGESEGSTLRQKNEKCVEGVRKMSAKVERKGAKRMEKKLT